MTQNCIFDLYGTLLDIHTDESMPSLWRRMALFMSFQGAAYKADELRRAYGAAIERDIDSISVVFPAVAKEHIEPDIRRVIGALYRQKGVTPNADRVQDTATLFRTLSMRQLTVYPEAETVLRILRKRGKGVYLLSNAQAAFTMAELVHLQLVSLFDGIVLSSDVGIKKPDKAIFDYILSKYGLRPETCLMIGNDMEADMQGAASVGMAGRYIHTKQSPEREKPVPPNCSVIHRLSDIL